MHLYLHVPFCARRCSYCDFAIAVRARVPSAQFVGLVSKEWEIRRQERPWATTGALATIYFGGGTPSRLEPDHIGELLAILTRDKPLLPGAEVTLEANPEDVTPDRAVAWQAAGINRVSLGVQSFAPDVLTWMHRTHRADQVPAAVNALRSAGIRSISVDLIYALPTEIERDWSSDLDQALALEPDHLSLYGLTVEPHTPLARWVDRGEVQATPEDRYAAEFLEAHQRLGVAGYDHYEVSNYALPGRQASHNSAYWHRAPYLGLGPSAHSHAGNRRWWNLREWADWERAMEAGRETVAGDETLDPDSMMMERLYLGLRTSLGVDPALLPHGLADRWQQEGWATLSPGRIQLTAEGWLRLDALVAQAAGEGSRRQA